MPKEVSKEDHLKENQDPNHLKKLLRRNLKDHQKEDHQKEDQEK